MKKYKLITHRKTHIIESNRFFIIHENKWSDNSSVESILFEYNDECVDEIPIVDFFELYLEVSGEWVLLVKNK